MHFDANTLRDIVVVLIPMILSLSVHEFAHAWSAFKLGDDTARAQGRLTLNPIAHIDPIGTIVLPIISILSSGASFFGWAKPVPVSPYRFSRKVSMRTGMMLTALAGPLSNVALAFVVAGLLAAVIELGTAGSPATEAGIKLLSIFYQMNLVLAVFNMIPIYPLDGSRLLPVHIQEKMARHAMVWMLGLLLLINVSYVQSAMGFVIRLLGGLLFGFWSLIF